MRYTSPDYSARIRERIQRVKDGIAELERQEKRKQEKVDETQHNE